jgi:hypothetical protein
MLNIASNKIAKPCLIVNFKSALFFINKYPRIKKEAKSILEAVKKRGVEEKSAILPNGKQHDQRANKKYGMNSILLFLICKHI